MRDVHVFACGNERLEGEGRRAGVRGDWVVAPAAVGLDGRLEVGDRLRHGGVALWRAAGEQRLDDDRRRIGIARAAEAPAAISKLRGLEGRDGVRRDRIPGACQADHRDRLAEVVSGVLAGGGVQPAGDVGDQIRAVDGLRVQPQRLCAKRGLGRGSRFHGIFGVRLQVVRGGLPARQHVLVRVEARGADGEDAIHHLAGSVLLRVRVVCTVGILDGEQEGSALCGGR